MGQALKTCAPYCFPHPLPEKEEYYRVMGPRTGTETDGATALTAQPAEDMDQRRNSFATIQHHCKRKMEEGDTWYVLGCDWWKKLEEYSQDEGAPHPGPIDNSALLLHPGSSRLKEHISERNDYTFIHEDGWELIARRFSLTQDSVPLPRPVYLTGLFSKAARVELRLLEIRLALYSKPSNVRELDISRGSSFETFLKKVQELFSLDSLEKVRFFIVHEDKKYELVDIKKERDKAAKSSSVLTVDGTSLFHSGMLLHLDVQDEQGNWAVPSRYYAAKNEEDGTLTGTENHPPSSNPIAIPLPSTSSAPHLHGSSSFTRSGMSYGAGSSDFLPGRFNTQTAPGLCGLQNLGNTCFMNSALQCLSNCPPLTDYFLSEDWGSDVNEANPLGMGGRIAKAYANLVRQLWSGTASSFIPRDFKYTVGQFAPQFSGYQQQDSQELLSFLLDGLHEDLNRIRDKPYVELKDADGRPDEVVAPEAWSDYKKRNDSVITDLFHGLLKSKLVCPVCDKVSVKFDPFCYLAIPLPVKKERQVSVTLVSALPDFTWTKYKVAIPKWNGKAFDLLEGLSKITGVETKCLVLAELYESRVRSFFRPFDILLDNHVSERDNLYAFAVSEEEAAYPVTVCVYQRCPRQYERLSPSSEWTLTASPIVFKMPDGFTSAQLHGAVEARARRVFPNLPSLNDPWPVPKQGSPDGDDSGVDDAEGSSGNDSHTGSPMDTDDPVSSANNKRQLYRLRKVNSFGTNVLNSGDVELPRVGPESEEILVSLLSHPMYFAVDWDMEAFSTFVATTSLNVEQHESFRAVTTRKAIQLTDCLRLFSEQEKLGKDDLWYCPDCKEHREATKEMGLWTAPRFLIIHLKRFSYTRTLRDKIEAFVDFPIRGLDMGPYILSNSGGDPILYDLVAVSNHMGGLGGGHYTAYGLNKNNRRWYNFDDSHVSPCSEDSVQSKMAYVLVYMQRAVITPGADPNVELECEDMDE